MVNKVTDMSLVEALFAGWDKTLIWSCLQQVMGNVYVAEGRPASAAAFLADLCFFAGEPERELVCYKPEECTGDFIIMVPQSEGWGTLIEECYGDKARRVVRYAIKKEPQVFDVDYLKGLTASLAPEYSVQLIDKAIYEYCRNHEWCRDFVSQYADYETFTRLGVGVVILKDGVPVSGASSYTSYQGGIEVQIDTREDYRRQGLATVGGARLILECLERGIYPSWDAHNSWSVALAEKLGYYFDREYTAYEIEGY